MNKKFVSIGVTPDTRERLQRLAEDKNISVSLLLDLFSEYAIKEDLVIDFFIKPSKAKK